MAIFDNLGKSAQQANAAPMDYGARIADIRSDPMRYIRQAGVQIPEEMQRDPRAMCMHLLQTNQVPAARRGMAQPLLNMLMGRR